MAAGGYAWWYLDALSTDGQWGVALIAFVGSVFSPYYAWQRRWRGDARADPEAHCAINVALYRRGARGFSSHWAMTERGRLDLRRRPGLLGVGPSRLRWLDDGRLLAEIDERCAPWPSRLRGRLLLTPGVQPARAFALHAGGAHHWQPIAPAAWLQAEFDAPGCQWQGAAYLDANWGSRPLARDFRHWHWQRESLGPAGGARLRYWATQSDALQTRLALRLQPDGRLQAEPPPEPTPLPASRWGLARAALDGPPQQLLSLEDGPFYSRSLLVNRDSWAVHESLDLRRFASPWVQALLPFRMPRWAQPRR